MSLRSVSFCYMFVCVCVCVCIPPLQVSGAVTRLTVYRAASHRRKSEGFGRSLCLVFVPGHLRKGVGFLDILAGTEDLAWGLGRAREASSRT